MALLIALFSRFKSRSELVMENLVLRQQLVVMKCSVKRPKLRRRDRLFWVLVSRCWGKWREALIIVQPDTVVRWHKKGFKLFWRWTSAMGVSLQAGKQQT